MKKTLFTLLFLVSVSISAQGAFYLHGVNIANDDEEVFESIQVKYLSKLAQDEVNAGRMSGWALLKRVPRIGDASDYKFNYFWVHSFENIEQMVDRKPFWTNFKNKFGMDRSSLAGYKTKGNGTYYFKTITEFQTGEIGEYVILNDGRPNDLQKALNLSKKAGKIFEKNAKKHGMTGWGVAKKIAPQDKHNMSNIFFWDIYDSMKGVMKHLAYESVIAEVPKEMNNEFNENMPEGMMHRNVCRILVATVPKK